MVAKKQERRRIAGAKDFATPQLGTPRQAHLVFGR